MRKKKNVNNPNKSDTYNSLTRCRLNTMLCIGLWHRKMCTGRWKFRVANNIEEQCNSMSSCSPQRFCNIHNFDRPVYINTHTTYARTSSGNHRPFVFRPGQRYMHECMVIHIRGAVEVTKGYAGAAVAVICVKGKVPLTNHQNNTHTHTHKRTNEQTARARARVI